MADISKTEQLTQKQSRRMLILGGGGVPFKLLICYTLLAPADFKPKTPEKNKDMPFLSCLSFICLSLFGTDQTIWSALALDTRGRTAEHTFSGLLLNNW